jgi:hypothetical protein
MVVITVTKVSHIPRTRLLLELPLTVVPVLHLPRATKTALIDPVFTAVFQSFPCTRLNFPLWWFLNRILKPDYEQCIEDCDFELLYE